MSASIKMGLHQLFLNILLILLSFDVTRAREPDEDVTEIFSHTLDVTVSNNKLCLIYFYTDDCVECEKKLPILSKLLTASKESLVLSELLIGKLKSVEAAARFSVTQFPSLVYFRNGYPMLYDGKNLQAEDIYEWLEQNTDVITKTLDDESFEHLTQAGTGATTGDWLVIFHQPGCSGMLAAIKSVGGRLNHKLNAAKVDVTVNKELQKRFNIQGCPTIILFRLGKMYRYVMTHRDVTSLMNFTDGWFKNVPAVKVLPPPSPFDQLVEKVTEYLKTHARKPSLNMILTVVGLLATLFLIWFYYYCRGQSWKKKKGN